MPILALLLGSALFAYVTSRKRSLTGNEKNDVPKPARAMPARKPGLKNAAAEPVASEYTIRGSNTFRKSSNAFTGGLPL